MKGKRIIKIISISIISLILLIVLVVGGYVSYVSIQYYRIENLEELTPENNQTTVMDIANSFSVITYNIGFGAYNQDFSFFMDSGTMLDGTPVNGVNSKAASRDVVLANTNGAISSVSSYNADFYFFQEVDTSSTRSFKVNQYDMLKEIGSDYSLTYAKNFHSAYLMYPLNDFHGQVNSGITMLSKYKIDDSTRYSFPVDPSFPARFFDLDRCFMLTRIALSNNKELVLINLHMSAYDEGGTIRAAQLQMLNEVMATEYAKGNYIIAGGDFNHDIAGSVNLFETTQEIPEWVYVLTNEDLTEGMSFASATNAPTCRSTDMNYTKGVNYSVVIDGFIISDNININSVENIDLDFMYSDHNPAKLVFSFD